MGMLLFTCALALVIWLLVFRNELQRRRPEWHWYLVGYPVTALRVAFTWRRVAYLNGLTVSHKPNRRVLGDLEIKGEPLRTPHPAHIVPARHALRAGSAGPTASGTDTRALPRLVRRLRPRLAGPLGPRRLPGTRHRNDHRDGT